MDVYGCVVGRSAGDGAGRGFGRPHLVLRVGGASAPDKPGGPGSEGRAADTASGRSAAARILFLLEYGAGLVYCALPAAGDLAVLTCQLCGESAAVPASFP